MCGKTLNENEVFLGPLGSEYEGRPLCRKCYFMLLHRLLYILKSYQDEKVRYEDDYSVSSTKYDLPKSGE